jgi:tetratricopeptide (TPR) repeat protein
MKQMATALILLLGLTGALAEGADRDSLAAKATAAFAAKNWQEAETIFKQLVAFEPTRWDFQQKLVNAQIALEHYDEALASCDKAIAYGYKGAEGMAPPNAEKAKAALATLLTTRGNILLTQHRMADAIAAYEKAAAVSTNPGVAYFNICALLYNQGRIQEVAPACDKAIAADPAKADAYFIKGSALFGDARIENGKMVLPDGAVQALQKYLELAPSGSHVTDVKAMLTSVGQTIETTYQNRKRN